MRIFMADESNFLFIPLIQMTCTIMLQAFRPGGNPEGARYHGRTADALASEVDEGRGKPR